jgi:glycosyltransferase involved in cell wall biosynthesis
VLRPRVAVVVPCFNDGKYLREALASVSQQEPCEVVVVDDGSRDPMTLDVLEELRMSGTMVVTQVNSGLGPARMTGVRNTTAPFIHPLDADDLLAPGALTLLADVLEARPEAGLAWGSYRSFGTTSCYFPSAPDLDPWRITYLDEIPATCMIRRETIEQYGGWEHTGYEDWDLWMRYAESGVVGIGLTEVTLLHRQHSAPRLYTTTLETHARHWLTLESRHMALFRARGRNRSLSSSPRSMKIALSVIETIPGLSPLRKQQLWGMARYLLQRDRASSCYRGPLVRIRDSLNGRLRRHDG